VNRPVCTSPVISACWRLMPLMWKWAVLGFEPMTYGSGSECATHYTRAPHIAPMAINSYMQVYSNEYIRTAVRNCLAISETRISTGRLLQTEGAACRVERTSCCFSSYSRLGMEESRWWRIYKCRVYRDVYYLLQEVSRQGCLSTVFQTRALPPCTS